MNDRCSPYESIPTIIRIQWSKKLRLMTDIILIGNYIQSTISKLKFPNPKILRKKIIANRVC